MTRSEDLKGISIDRLKALRKLAPASLEQYLSGLGLFLDYIGSTPDSLVRTTQENPKTFEKQFVEYIAVKEKATSPATVALIRNSVKKFLDVNRVEGIDWNYISECIPEKKRYGEDRAPPTEVIRRLVDASDLRLKCLILFLCSSGARIGSIDYLKWRDFTEIKHSGMKFARVTIYRGEREQYDTFVTPEAYSLLLEYKKQRETIGEEVTPLSPVFVTLSNIDAFRAHRIRQVKARSIKNSLRRVTRQLGLRTVIHEGQNARRYDWKECHGFRKFFKTRLEMSSAKPSITEMMMGHSIGISGSYMKPTDDEIVAEYAKGIPSLTIGRSSGVQNRNEIEDIITRKGLILAGFNEEELQQMGRDLSKLTTEEIQEMVRRKQMQRMGLGNGNNQQVVSMDEVEKWVEQGFEFVQQLPHDKAIIRLPTMRVLAS